MRRAYFGTDGFRGEANGQLTPERAFLVGRVLGWHFSQRGEKRARIVIGKDTRRSGYMLEAALVAGLAASGSDAYLLHVTTTPSVAYVVRADGFDGGIMISASHNPYEDNGIKLFNGQGEKMGEDVLALLERHLNGEAPTLPYAKGAQIGRSVDYVAGRNRYVGGLISLGMHSFKGWKVGLDCANGSAWHIAKVVFDGLGATTYCLGAEPNGTNINVACGSTHPQSLQTFVKEKGLDVGFAFDGDADRCLCVDEKGNLVDGDQMLYLFARYMQERGELHQNTVVATVMSNFGLRQGLKELGIHLECTSVGDKHIHACMAKGGFALGGEQSGHILFSKYGGTGDGIITALKVMEVLIEKKSALSGLVAPLVLYPQIQRNISVKEREKEKILTMERVQKALQLAQRKLEGRGRLLVRPSGTEPVIRILAEGEEGLCKACVEDLTTAIEEAISS
ncbi:MAG: phosphoglucosamine mutase [Clostridia bacterium]|nr:phosphoglucosamine mutase [Clostridia bacterium]